MTEYAVVRCRATQSLLLGKIERQGFADPAEASRWRRLNTPGQAFQVARLVNGVPSFLTSQDQMEIGLNA